MTTLVLYFIRNRLLLFRFKRFWIGEVVFAPILKFKDKVQNAIHNQQYLKIKSRKFLKYFGKFVNRNEVKSGNLLILG